MAPCWSIHKFGSIYSCYEKESITKLDRFTLIIKASNPDQLSGFCSRIFFNKYISFVIIPSPELRLMTYSCPYLRWLEADLIGLI